MQAEILEATPVKQPDDTIKWTLCHVQGTSKACGDAPGNYPAVNVAAKKADVPFKITITNDQTGLGIKYAPEPIWSQWGAKTSGPWTTAPSPANVADLENINVENTTVLKFRDTNETPGEITYQLNFVGEGDKQVAPLDPVIINGGQDIMETGGTGYTGTGTKQNYDRNFLSDASTGVVIVLAVLLVILGAAVGALIAKRF